MDATEIESASVSGSFHWLGALSPTLIMAIIEQVHIYLSSQGASIAE